MRIIQNNPYRTVGLLVGATAKEQERQVRRLRQFIEAEQEPQDDFSFPSLGPIHRTLDNVNEATSKLNLDGDKIMAALFWFYKGNPITDEPAFEALKEADLDQVLSIWTRLISSGVVSQRNASAYNNLGTLYLSGILKVTNSAEFIEQGISLKLQFLESDYIKEFKALATDETYKTTKKELQLLFLNQLQAEIETSGGITSTKLLEILQKQNFSAKEDFLNGFVLKPIEQIEKKIEESKVKRNSNKSNAINIGLALHKQTANNLDQLKSILGVSNIKYSSIADKVANEVLQCSIDYFNYHQENELDDDYFDPAYNLAISAKTIAIGKLTKDRILDTLDTLEELKDKEILQAIQVLKSIKDAYVSNEAKIRQQVNSMPLGPRQTINWSKVNEMIANSLDWDKVVALIQEVIPVKSINKIQKSSNAAKLNEYKTLVDFVMSKLIGYRNTKISYIRFWTTESPSTLSSSSSPSYSSSQSEFSFAENAWWILGLVGVVIGLATELGVGCIVTGFIGIGIGLKFNK